MPWPKRFTLQKCTQSNTDKTDPPQAGSISFCTNIHNCLEAAEVKTIPTVAQNINILFLKIKTE
jgi:hypothetical protein